MESFERKDYEDMLYALSDETFSEERAGERLEWFKNVYSPLYPQFFERYKGAGKISDAEGSINNIKAFLKKRKDNIKKMMTTQKGLKQLAGYKNAVREAEAKSVPQERGV